VRGAALFGILLLLDLPAIAQTPGALPLRDRARYQVKEIAGPSSLLSAGAISGIRLWYGEPREWGQGMAGFGRRYGYTMAGRAVNNGIKFGAGALIGDDPRYVPSQAKGLGTRIRYAIVHTFILPRRDGGTIFAWSRLAGDYGSGFISNAWYPARYGGPGHALVRGTLSLSGDIGANLFREFWPDVRKRIFRKRPSKHYN
jgi:hypothetical protein